MVSINAFSVLIVEMPSEMKSEHPFKDFQLKEQQGGGTGNTSAAGNGFLLQHMQVEEQCEELLPCN